MTSMQQINYIAAEAKKLGIDYSEYVKKYGHTLPKPKKRKWKEIPLFNDSRSGRPRDRVECVCARCGGKFLAGKKSAKWCPDCTDELKRVRAHEQYLRRKENGPTKKAPPKKEEEPQEKIVYCAGCGVKMTVQNLKQKYCETCRVEKLKQYQSEYRKERKAAKAK